VIVSRGFWDGRETIPRPPADVPEADLNDARKRLADGLMAAAKGDATATTGPFARPDRTPADRALGYAVATSPEISQPRNKPAAVRAAPAALAMPVAVAVAAPMPDPAPTPAVVTRKGAASVALMPPIAHRNQRAIDPLSDPWLRGAILTASVQDAMTVTQCGDPDYARLVEFMQKPRSAVMMSFSMDPHSGMTDKSFTGSAVVFQGTVSFEAARTAALR
jgi:hypothetical protein